MSDQVIDSGQIETAEDAQNAPPPSPLNKPAPSPADLARQAQPKFQQPEFQQPEFQQPEFDPPTPPDDGKPKGKRLETIEDYEKALADQRKENAKWRTKLREAEPIVEEHQKRIEAEKSETQKAIERAEAAELRDRQRQEDFDRLALAVDHGIDPDNIDLIGSGSREEMEAKALKVKAMQQAKENTAPPSNRPVEGLRPGASPEPPQPADDSYPEAWKPNHVKERERSQYGQ